MARACDAKDMKAVVFTLGCKVNAYESYAIMGELASLGYETSEELGYADLYIINTCAVTAEAQKKSRQAIARVRKFNKNAKIIVTGCASENSKNDFWGKDGVILVTGAKRKDEILSLLRRGETGAVLSEEDKYHNFSAFPKTSHSRVYIKVEDGCNNFCSYCIIPYLRGRVRSRAPEEVRREIEFLSPAEAVITGINLSAYDCEGGLKRLIEALFGLKCRIRLGSLEVNAIDEEFLTALKGLEDFAPHFHLSLQSGSDAVLKSMNRHYTREEFIRKCELIREFFPSAAITTDIIVGYSTETEEDFCDTLDLVNTVKFADVHCFPYSKREGTVGAKLKELPASVKSERMERLLALKYALKREFTEKMLGKETEIIPEETDGEYTVGYTANYLRCRVKGSNLSGKIKVKIVGMNADGAEAQIL